MSLFGFAIWIGLAISWLFFHGGPPGASEMGTPERTTETDTARERARVEAEPLLPAEKWLIGGSFVLGWLIGGGLALGLALLGLLLWVSKAYLPAG